MDFSPEVFGLGDMSALTSRRLQGAVPPGASRDPGMSAPPPPARLHHPESTSGDCSSSSCASSCSSCSSSLPGVASSNLPGGRSSDGGVNEVTVPPVGAWPAGAWPDDASLSVYLDAHTWSDHNHNLLLEGPTAAGQPGVGRRSRGAEEDLSARGGCSSPDSDATEVPARDEDDDDDDDDDEEEEEAGEEESLFLSVSSELSLETPARMAPPLASPSSTSSPSSPSHSSPSSSTPAPTHLLPEAELCLKTAPPPGQPEQTGRTSAAISTATKQANQEARVARRPDLKNIKAKVVSRPAPSAAKPSNQRQSAQANQRRTVARKEEVHVSEEKGERLATGGVKTRPSPSHSLQSEDRSRCAVANRALSRPRRPDLGSEVTDMLPVANTVNKTTADRPPRQTISSKLGPRQQAGRRAPRTSSTTGPPGPGGSGPRPAQAESSSLGKEAASGGGGAPARARLSHTQGIPKPRPTAERSSSLAIQYSVPTHSRAASSVSPPPPSSSKLPVKGLPRSLSSSSLGSSPAHKCTEAPGADPPAGLRGLGRPLGPSTAARTDANANANSNASNNVGTRTPRTRGRAYSLQNSTTNTGLRTPAAAGPFPARPTNHKMAISANQVPPANLSHPLQRSSSSKFNQTTSPVDKNKARVPVGRPVTSPPAAPPPSLQQQQPPSGRPAPDRLNGNVSPPRLPQTPEARPPASSCSSSSSAPRGLGVCGGSRTRGGAPLHMAGGPGPGAQPGGPGPGAQPGGSGPGVQPGGPGPGAQPGGAVRRVEGKRSYSQEQEKRLRVTLVQSNRRGEALTTVIQHLLSEHELVLKQKQDLSHQLTNLKDELASSALSCERIQREKGEVLRSAEEQHAADLAQLEDRLRSFYQAEWDKVHQRYQEEADSYRALMERQVDELRYRQEAELTQQEMTYKQETKSLTERFESSIQVLQSRHQDEVDQLDRRRQETEASLSERLQVLLQEKEELQEEAMRRATTEPQFLYLQQELDSLHVVLEMKTSQLHLKEQKLMEMETLVDTNMKLEDCLNRVQQENEDYRARMNKHAALSKQLTSEQALLQQNLQKESKVNKRLSMENEELLWKLHHAEPPGSPRQLSPTSPCHSPQSPPPFPTATPLSPR